jgi:hypothetical protein
MAASVSLIKALGGGWSTTNLPTAQKETHPQTTNGQ